VRGCGFVLIRAASIFLSALALLLAPLSHAVPKVHSFNFAVIGQQAAKDDVTLLESIKRVNQSKASFFVISGIRTQQEACSDGVFQRRKKILDAVEIPVVVSLAARDWAECQNEKGESAAQERLNFLRGMLFENDQAVRETKIQVVRQSATVKFRHYAENARWESDGIQFATVNLPSNNNHYLAAAGRNNEFEDRLIANRQWLQRIFINAKSRKMKGIVLFVDGNPLAAPAKSPTPDQRDGFAETRKQIAMLAKKFSGKVLLIHGQQSSGHITWRDNLAVIGIGRGALEVGVKRGANVTFSIKRIGEFKRDQ